MPIVTKVQHMLNLAHAILNQKLDINLGVFAVEMKGLDFFET